MNQEKYQSLVESTRGWIWELTRDGVFTYASSHVEPMLGYTPEEVCGLTPFDLMPEGEVDRIRKFFTDVVTQGESVIALRNVVLHKDGRRVALETSGVPLFDESGRVTGMRGINCLIPEHKLSEKAINESEARYRTLFESAGDAIFLMTGEMFVDCNQRTLELFGCKRMEIVGHSPVEFSPLVQPDGRDSVEKAGKKISKALDGDPQLFEWQHKKLNGTLFDAEVSLNPVALSTGVHLQAIVRDITERKRIEEMMMQSEKMTSVGELAAGMAHEINNPLAGMMQSAELMTKRLTEDMAANTVAASDAGTSMDAIRAFMNERGVYLMLDYIHESGVRAAKIVADMLSFARKSDSSFSPCDLVELMDQTVDLACNNYDLKKKFDFRQIEIIKKYEDNLPLVPCESAKIQQVLLNVLRNGAEAMQDAMGNDEENPPRFIIRLDCKRETGMVRIEITDNGPGMDEATRKRAFEPFFTTKPPDRGTGLGLSVSYFIISKNHDGKMSVESAPGRGTKFIIQLPLERKKD
ncbi:MAG: PAS domain S-box protein [Proteobacteria bacterium]|nr:PAS domain S-box protein [Pseudomonadota bacterium]